MEPVLTVQEVPPFPAIWAVDPSEEKLRPTLRALEEIKMILGGSFIRVHPVFACKNAPHRLEQGRQDVSEYLRPLGLQEAPRAKILPVASDNRVEWAQKVLEFARLQKAEMILLTSHGRSTLGFFFLGSFAFELLCRSSIPILFINPKPYQSEYSRKVLFATDFSEESKVAYRMFLKLIAGRDFELILFHVLPSVDELMRQGQWTGMMPPLRSEYREELRAWSEDQLEDWLDRAQDAGVKTQNYSLAEHNLSKPAHAIEDKATEENVCLIGMSSHAKPGGEGYIGGVSQALITSQKFNLWVCGPEATKFNK